MGASRTLPAQPFSRPVSTVYQESVRVLPLLPFQTAQPVLATSVLRVKGISTPKASVNAQP